jgi:hypothetical protein
LEMVDEQAATSAPDIGSAEIQPSQDAPNWHELISEALKVVEVPVNAETFIKKWDSASKPIAMKCADGHKYVIKGTNSGRQAANDRLAGKLAVLAQAPVPPVALIDVKAEIVAATPEISYFTAGLSHGSRIEEECTERLGIEQIAGGDNRARFSSAAIFHGWLFPQDQQFIYGKDPPNRVYSVDHGHCFPSGPDWTIDSLAAAGEAKADQGTVDACGLTESELNVACQPLKLVSPEQIASAVSSIYDGWGVTHVEAVALCNYLENRRKQLVQRYCS